MKLLLVSIFSFSLSFAFSINTFPLDLNKLFPKNKFLLCLNLEVTSGQWIQLNDKDKKVQMSLGFKVETWYGLVWYWIIFQRWQSLDFMFFQEVYGIYENINFWCIQIDSSIFHICWLYISSLDCINIMLRLAFVTTFWYRLHLCN